MLPLGDRTPSRPAPLHSRDPGVVGFLQPHHPFTRLVAAHQTHDFGLARALTAALFESRAFRLAAGAAMTTAGGSLDGADGWLARRQQIASDFGARFDMEIDALLILVLAILVSRFEKAGAWVIVSGLLRYIFAGAGRYWPWLAAPLPPSRRRQAICVVQIVALTCALLPAVKPPLSKMFAAVALVSLVYSSQWISCGCGDARSNRAFKRVAPQPWASGMSSLRSRHSSRRWRSSTRRSFQTSGDAGRSLRGEISLEVRGISW